MQHEPVMIVGRRPEAVQVDAMVYNTTFMSKTNCLKWMAWAFVLIGVTFLPTSDTGAGPGQHKIAICHKGQTLELPEPAIQAHINHGDTLGPCSVTPSKNK